jgi:hypothetical protein
MALVRENPRTPPESIPGRGHVLPDGFFWARYPPLENILKKHMAEYYRLSMEMCQSVDQQSFNNRLVQEVMAEAESRSWTFDPQSFGDLKILRDRIRCYYKTHIQNAKKRLKTMLRNPTKRSNAIHLMQHYDLIQQAATAAQAITKRESSTTRKASSTTSSLSRSKKRESDNSSTSDIDVRVSDDDTLGRKRRRTRLS